MPAIQHGTNRVDAVEGQASEKPQGRKPRNKDTATSRSTMLWGFVFGVVVRAHVLGSPAAMRPA